MRVIAQRLTVLVSLVALLGVAQRASAQPEITNDFKFNSGQDVQPVFEGWSRSPDGGFVMHFGYLNRNWAQELSVPIGPENSVEPNGPDRGQPTFFYTRTNRNLFSVPVPKDFGKKEVVWTIVANGRTQKAFGWLQPEWEIDPAGGASLGGQQSAEARRNQPPTITVSAPGTASVGATLNLTALVTDDGLPKPAPEKKAAIGQETPAILQGGVDAPVNVPSVASSGRGQTGPKIQGPSVTWIVWRGPAGVAFEPSVVPVKDGSAQTAVVFARPGEYVLRARASDRVLTADREVKITVGPTP
jgi:hypothetical protein